MNHREMMQALLDGQTLYNPFHPSIHLQLINEQIRDIVNNRRDAIPSDPTHWAIKPSTITINGIEVPEPVRASLALGAIYYVPCITTKKPWVKTHWTGENADYERLEYGVVHLTEEAALAHATALLSFTKL